MDFLDYMSRLSKVIVLYTDRLD